MPPPPNSPLPRGSQRAVLFPGGGPQLTAPPQPRNALGSASRTAPAPAMAPGGGCIWGGGGSQSIPHRPPPPHRSRRAVLARPLFSGAPARGRCVAGDVCKQTARPRSPLPAWRESSPPPLQKPRPNSPLRNGEGFFGGGGGVHCSLGGTVALEGGILWSRGGPYNLGWAPWSWGGPYGLGGSL